MSIQRLMDRLRVQSLIQRLRREYGDDQAWAILREAMEIEIRVPEQFRKQKSRDLSTKDKY